MSWWSRGPGGCWPRPWRPRSPTTSIVMSVTVDEAGHRLVVRNGKAPERSLVTGAGALKVRAPRVDDRREGRRFSSYILPRYARRSPKVAEVLPILYLRGLSTGDFDPALGGVLRHRMPGCHRRRSAGCSRPGATNTRRSSPGTCPGRTSSTCGPTGCISVSAWRRTGCAAWSSSGSEPTAPKQLLGVFRWVSGIDRIVGRSAPGPPGPGHDRTGGGGR